jgi:OPT family oligopeptide transporter
MLGYGWAGLFRKYLVDSPYMWWPANLVQVSLFRYFASSFPVLFNNCMIQRFLSSLFLRIEPSYVHVKYRALHEKEKRPKGGHTRLQFFFLVFVTSFAYYLVPSYLFPSISYLSFVCWIWKDSITAQQIGGGVHGLGLGSMGFDWSTVAGFLGSPLATPGFAIVNTLIGFFVFVYIVNPIFYWSNAYDAKKFPLFSSHTFDSDGQRYNLTRILNQKTFDIDYAAYNSYSKLYLSIFFALTYGLSFATLTATISHVALYNGK